MTLSIDTDKRDELGISTDAYLLLYTMWVMRSTDKDAVHSALLWERNKISKLIKECEAAGLFDGVTGEFSEEWVSLFNPLEKVELSGLGALAGAIIEYLREATGREFRGGKQFTKAIGDLARKVPPQYMELPQCKRMISWANEKWGEQYREAIAPTLFSKTTPEKYIERCEKANEYYRTKIAKQSQVLSIEPTVKVDKATDLFEMYEVNQNNQQ